MYVFLAIWPDVQRYVVRLDSCRRLGVGASSLPPSTSQGGFDKEIVRNLHFSSQTGLMQVLPGHLLADQR